jgi:dienelactone hydrolase
MLYKLRLCFAGILIFTAMCNAQAQPQVPVDQAAADFKKLLERPHGALRPSSQIVKTDSVIVEKGQFYSEETEKVPFLIYKPLNIKSKLPVVICLYGTGGSMESQEMRQMLFKFSQLGFMAISIDARFHGGRGQKPGSASYVEAITKAWQNQDPKTQTHPFFYDTAYDLWRLTDYLVSRYDVDASRIGMTGISMGGIETWMAASVDKRIKVAVPIIAAQSFRWSLENERWQGRVGTIRAAHEIAAKELGDTGINQRNIKVVWAKLLPGILDEFDCPSMIRLFAPRPLLLLSNGNDQNCPLPGAEIAFVSAKKAYESLNAADKLKINVTPDEPHRFLPVHMNLATEWFLKWL